MLLAAFPAGPFGTNCYVAATGPGTECIIVDPGMGAADGIASIVAEHRLKPVAVLVTHGHADHTFSVTPIAGTYDATAYIHSDDRGLLIDPTPAHGPDIAPLLLSHGYSYAEPERVVELRDGLEIELAGMSFTVDHTPGHTRGSITFRTPYDQNDISQLMFTGDLLFAGSIGRTDLPGGDHAAMLNSLRTKVLPLADDIVILPGHGEQSSIGRERAYNPYLQDLS